MSIGGEEAEARTLMHGILRPPTGPTTNQGESLFPTFRMLHVLLMLLLVM